MYFNKCQNRLSCGGFGGGASRAAGQATLEIVPRKAAGKPGAPGLFAEASATSLAFGSGALAVTLCIKHTSRVHAIHWQICLEATMPAMVVWVLLFGSVLGWNPLFPLPSWVYGTIGSGDGQSMNSRSWFFSIPSDPLDPFWRLGEIHSEWFCARPAGCVELLQLFRKCCCFCTECFLFCCNNVTSCFFILILLCQLWKFLHLSDNSCRIHIIYIYIYTLLYIIVKKSSWYS